MCEQQHRDTYTCHFVLTCNVNAIYWIVDAGLRAVSTLRKQQAAGISEQSKRSRCDISFVYVQREWQGSEFAISKLRLVQLHSADRKVIGHSERLRRGWCHGFDSGRILCNNSHTYNHCQLNVFEIAYAILSSVNETQSTYFLVNMYLQCLCLFRELMSTSCITIKIVNFST